MNIDSPLRGGCITRLGGDLMLKIGLFSKLSLTTIKTLRYYEQEHLLMPAYIDKFTGYRYYETYQLLELNKIISLRQLGLSIEDIKDIMAGSSLEQHLEKRKEVLKQELAVSKMQLTRIENILENKESESMKREVIVKELPAYTVFYKEGVLSSYADITDFILTAGAETGKANPNLKCIQPDYCFMEYLDGEYRDTNIKARYSQAVEKAGLETENIKFKTLPSVTVASIYHKGAYETLGETYAYILNWVEEQGYQIDGGIRESYIDGMWNKENQEEWLTEIQVPITK